MSILTKSYQIHVILKWLKVDEADFRTWVITNDVLSLWFKGESDVREYLLSSEPDEFVKTGKEKYWSSPVEIGIRKSMVTEIAVKAGDGQALVSDAGLCSVSMIDNNGIHRCVKKENHRFRHSSLSDRSKPWRKWW